MASQNILRYDSREQNIRDLTFDKDEIGIVGYFQSYLGEPKEEKIYSEITLFIGQLPEPIVTVEENADFLKKLYMMNGDIDERNYRGEHVGLYSVSEGNLYLKPYDRFKNRS